MNYQSKRNGTLQRNSSININNSSDKYHGIDNLKQNHPQNFSYFLKSLVRTVGDIIIRGINQSAWFIKKYYLVIAYNP